MRQASGATLPCRWERLPVAFPWLWYRSAWGWARDGRYSRRIGRRITKDLLPVNNDPSALNLLRHNNSRRIRRIRRISYNLIRENDSFRKTLFYGRAGNILRRSFVLRILRKTALYPSRVKPLQNNNSRRIRRIRRIETPPKTDFETDDLTSQSGLQKRCHHWALSQFQQHNTEPVL